MAIATTLWGTPALSSRRSGPQQKSEPAPVFSLSETNQCVCSSLCAPGASRPRGASRCGVPGEFSGRSALWSPSAFRAAASWSAERRRERIRRRADQWATPKRGLAGSRLACVAPALDHLFESAGFAAPAAARPPPAWCGWTGLLEMLRLNRRNVRPRNRCRYRHLRRRYWVKSRPPEVRSLADSNGSLRPLIPAGGVTNCFASS